MGSTTSSATTPPSPISGDDRSSPARIRDAAITRFAADGVDRTSVRAIATEAGVSAGLVLHHFGSKEQLRAACDEHVAGLIRDQKHAAMQAGAGLDPAAVLRSYGDGPPLLAYLARTLVDGSPKVNTLIDEMVADAEEYLAEGERSGLLRPSDDPRGRACVLVLFSLGAVVLHEHAERLLGADLLGAPDGLGPYMLPAFEVLAGGILTPDSYAELRPLLEDAVTGEET
ncbi:MAG: TetR family transcriptional regulator [Nitriliruptoraceae bacterium]